MKKLNIEQRHSLGLPQTDSGLVNNFQSGISGAESGAKASFNYIKNLGGKMADKASGINKGKTMEIPKMTDTSLIRKSIGLNESVFAKVEQLLEEYASRRITTNITAGGAGPTSDGVGVAGPNETPLKRPSTQDYGNAVRAKNDDLIQKSANANRATSKLDNSMTPGLKSEGIKSNYHNNNSQANLMTAQARAQKEDRLAEQE